VFFKQVFPKMAKESLIKFSYNFFEWKLSNEQTIYKEGDEPGDIFIIKLG